MPIKSTTTRYGAVAVTLHWLSALLIVALLITGFQLASTVDPNVKVQLLSVHAPLGIVILVLTLIRIAWWWLADKGPDRIAGKPRWRDTSARIVHRLFYIVIIGMAVSGIGVFVLSGAGPIVFSGAAGLLPDFQAYLPRMPHGIGARVMVLLLLLHAGAALYHQHIEKDGLLGRMWFGRHN